MHRKNTWLVASAFVSLAGLPLTASAQVPGQRLARNAVAIEAVGLTVSDMDRSLQFYTSVLTFVKESDQELLGPAEEALTGVFGSRARVVRLRLGQEHLILTEYIAASMPGRPAPVDSRSNDSWFQHVAIIVSDMDSAYRRLRSAKVRSASTGPQLLPITIPNAAGIRAFYFRDPDGHPLEILQFPLDKGDPKWHRPNQALFLGIDHTAIVVGQTGRSLAFYRDLLGLRVAGESHNFGTEQEHLNNVEGADLHITGLRAPDGPGVEFLEYLTPTDGRPYPGDERSDDLVHWETTIRVGDLAALMPALDSAGAPRLSRILVSDTEGNLGFAHGIVIRDPDGHAVRLIDRPN